MAAVPEDEEFIEHTTALALEERSKLIKSLRRFDMVFFTVCAFVGLDTLGTVANKGPQGFLWLVVLAVLESGELKGRKIGASWRIPPGAAPFTWPGLATA